MAFQPCANPECEYAAHGDPEVSIEFCCEKCEGRFNGEEWASGGKKKHTAYCTSKQENAYDVGGGCGARVWGQCEHPSALTWHSDPSVTTTGLYCCEKCEGLHQGADWAEGGKRHYKTCEKIEASSMASMNGGYGKAPAWGKGSSKGGPYAMMMEMLNQVQYGKGGGKAKSFGKSEGKSKKPSAGSQFAASQKVWVGGIPEGTSRDDLKAHFAVVGEPKFVSIKGTTGWVAFGTDFEAETAIEALNGSIFGDVMLEVDVWSGK